MYSLYIVSRVLFCHNSHARALSLVYIVYASRGSLISRHKLSCQTLVPSFLARLFTFQRGEATRERQYHYATLICAALFLQPTTTTTTRRGEEYSSEPHVFYMLNSRCAWKTQPEREARRFFSHPLHNLFFIFWTRWKTFLLLEGNK